MPFARRKMPKPPMQLPPVTTGAGGPALDIRGRRLGTLGIDWLRLVCDCGHEGAISVPDLAKRYGRDTRVRDAIAKVRCTRCGQTRIRKITLTG